jgi:hypothetical protein
MRFAAAAILIAAFLTAFAHISEAKPNWVTVKYTGASLRKNKKEGINSSNKNYLILAVKFDIINDSKNGDIITAIYDRNLNWNGVFTVTEMYRKEEHIGMSSQTQMVWKPASWNVKSSFKGTEPYKGEWFPGQVYKYEHTVFLGSLIKPYNGDWKATNEQAFKKFGFKLEKFSLDFQVASHK